MLKINSWVRLRENSKGERGQVVAFSKEKAEDLSYSYVYVRWREGVRMHKNEEVEEVKLDA